jgi:hypothetical protein
MAIASWKMGLVFQDERNRRLTRAEVEAIALRSKQALNGWWGENWGAPVCEEDRHLPTPVGEDCDYFRCGEPINAGDQGVTMPLLERNGPNGWKTRPLHMHLDCYLFSIGVGKQHKDGEPCNCPTTGLRTFLRDHGPA